MNSRQECAGGSGWHELAWLHQLSSLVANDDDLSKATTIALESICRLCGWPYGEAWLLDERRERLVPGPAWDGPAGEMGALAVRPAAIARGQDLPGVAWLRRESICWSDVSVADTPRAAVAVPLGLRAALAVPMMARSETMGVLAFFMPSDRQVDERARLLAGMMAMQFGQFIRRKRADDALRDSEQRYRLLVEHVGDAVFMLDPDGRILTWTPAAARLLGYADTGSGTLMLADLYPPEQRTSGEPARDLERALRAGRHEVEDWRLSQDGRPLWAHVVTCPIRGPDGELRGFAQFLQDWTLKRRLEQAARRESHELQRSNRELESFASLASHDLQEPLRKIRTFGDRLRVRHASALQGDAAGLVDRIADCALRMQRLIDDLLEYSRLAVRVKPSGLVDLGLVVREALSDLEPRFEESGGKVTVGNLPTVEGDQTHMRQLFLNLLANALKFTRPGVPPVVQISSQQTDTGMFAIRVEDNGIGFDPQYAEQIFGLLQRLHGRSEYEGTGLGLAICRRIAERHAGTIEAEGRPGEGATFTVTLPAVQPREPEGEQR